MCVYVCVCIDQWYINVSIDIPRLCSEWDANWQFLQQNVAVPLPGSYQEQKPLDYRRGGLSGPLEMQTSR